MVVLRASFLVGSCASLVLLSACSRDWSGPTDDEDSGADAGEDASSSGPTDGSVAPDATPPDGAQNGANGNDADAELPAVACGSLQCLHGATCSTGSAPPACVCPSGWSGTSCDTDVDECQGAHGCPSANPCENLPGGYTCAGELPDFPLPKGNTQRVLSEFERGMGTVLDKLTGLRWQLDISDTNTRSWAQANSDCLDATTAGFNDWRLPSYLELLTLVHGATLNDVVGYPALGEHVLAELENKNSFNLWTVTLDSDQSHVFQWYYGGWWAVNHSPVGQDARAAVRCVRRDQVKCTVPADKRLTRQGGSVIDACTKLVWTYETSPALTGSTTAEGYCSGLAIDGRSWRVPSFLELGSLVSGARTNGFLSGFSVLKGSYATSTREPVHPDDDGGIPMTDTVVIYDNNNGETTAVAKSNGVTPYVRCVSTP